MGKITANREAPSESLTGMQRDETQSPLMNWMEGNRKPEAAPTGRFKLKIPSLAQRIPLIPLRRLFSFLQSHPRAIGAILVVVAIPVLFFVIRPDGAAILQLDNSEIHFDDVTIHPLHDNGHDASGRSSQNENDSPNHSGRQSAVYVMESQTEISPIQPDTFAVKYSSDAKHAVWLTGTIEINETSFNETSFDETSQSRSLPGRARIGQRIEYFSQKRN